MIEKILQTPPLIVERDGRRYIEVTDGADVWLAPLGDGRWFFTQVVAKVVEPALVAYEKRRGSDAK